MRLYVRLFILCLLATPLLAAADPGTLPFLRAGAIEVAFDPLEPSYLPADTSTLRQGLCTGFPDLDGERPPITPQGECEMIVRSPPRLGLETDGAPGRGSLQISVRPTDLPAWNASTPVATACGLWDVSMSLDPDREQPVSTLAIEPSGDNTSQGVFAGAIQIAVLFHFYNRDKGTSLDLPAVVPLDLSGRWAAASDAGSLGSRASNLVLFAGEFLDGWSIVPGQASWGTRRCPVHPIASSSVLDGLNQSFHIDH
jgi:hypothetical protein